MFGFTLNKLQTQLKTMTCLAQPAGLRAVCAKILHLLLTQVAKPIVARVPVRVHEGWVVSAAACENAWEIVDYILVDRVLLCMLSNDDTEA